MTKDELKELVKSHFNLVEAPQANESTEEVIAEEMSALETPETPEQEEFADEDKGVKVLQEEEEKMEYPKMEDMIEVIAEVVEEKMGDMKSRLEKVEEKMAAMDDKKEMEEKKEMEVKEEMSATPAAEKTQPKAEFTFKNQIPEVRNKSRYEQMLGKLTK